MTTHERQEYAAQLKREMNCCQAVVRAFADTLDMLVDKLMQLSAGFGSGMGTMEGTCGALAGAIVVAETGCPETAAVQKRRFLERMKRMMPMTPVAKAEIASSVKNTRGSPSPETIGSLTFMP